MTGHDSPGPTVSPPRPTGRRSFLDRLLGVWAAGVATSIFYPIVRYLIPPDIPEAATQFADGGKASTLVPNSARIVPFGSAPAIIIHTVAGEFRAFSATCTHLACTVQ
jgi:cytochrome b6-f complex iron-sulfur subunit